MTSDNFLLCTESSGSALLLLWQCERGRDVLLSSFLESSKDTVLGERRSCFGLSKTTASNPWQPLASNPPDYPPS